MVNHIVKTVFFRLVFPLGLLAACLIRPSLISFIYGVLVLLLPWFPGFKPFNVAVSTVRFITVACLTVFLCILGQIVFQITLAATPPYGHQVQNCNTTLGILPSALGLEALDGVASAETARLILPEIIALLVALPTLIICVVLKLPPEPSPLECTEPLSNGPSHQDETPAAPPKASGGIAALLGRRVCDVVAIPFLGLVGIVYPCMLAVPYFLLFLGLMTYWAAYRQIRRPCFMVFKIIIAMYVGLHLCVLYAYQVLQTLVIFPDLAVRLVGLTPIVENVCETKQLLFPSQIWPALLNPALLFIYYLFLVINYRSFGEQCFTSTPRASAYLADDNSSVHEELIEPDDEENGEEVKKRDQKGRDTPGGRGGTSTRSQFLNRFFSVGTVPMDKSEAKQLSSFFGFFLRHSYVLALMTMMAWAITYHSWLSFVFLLLACVIWMVSDSRKACFYLSPLIVFYAEYIYGLNLTDSELPDVIRGVPLKQIGIERPDTVAFIPLLIKTLYSMPFFMTMRLFMRERSYKSFDEEEGRTRGGTYGTFATFGADFTSSTSLTFFSWTNRMMVKYWIYVCALVILLVSIRQPVVAYAVIYMLCFIWLIIILHISYRFWRATLLFYWVALVFFSVLVLILVYTYQFDGVPEWYFNVTKFDTDIMKSVGLERYSPAVLFQQLLTPLAFLIVVVLQLKFFHRPFLLLTRIDARAPQPGDRVSGAPATNEITSEPGVTPDADGAQITVIHPWWLKLKLAYYRITNVLWRLAEIHYHKLVAFSFIMLAVFEVNAVNFVFVICVVLMLPFRPWFHWGVSVIGAMWAAAILVAKLLFQMPFVPSDLAEVNCSVQYSSSNRSEVLRSSGPEWGGFLKSGDVAYYVKGYICVLVVLGFQPVVHLRQKYFRWYRGLPKFEDSIIFPDATRGEADHDITSMLKFLANYGFYKFGVEITLFACVAVVGARMDAMAVLYGIWLLVLLSLRRRKLAWVWRVFVLFLAISIPCQYAAAVGLPETWCIRYWWYMPQDLIVYLYLPDYFTPPDPLFLIGDFVLFLLACQQMHVFAVERSLNYFGGDNSEVVYRTADRELADINNPTPDFVTYQTSYLDTVKMFVFGYMHWITLLVIFIAGVGGISLFALGYLLSCFVFLWKGTELLLKPTVSLIRMWSALMFYSVVVIILKAILQWPACVYWPWLTENSCGLIQLFSVACLRPGNKYHEQVIREHKNPLLYKSQCFTQMSEAHAGYDIAVFVFVVIQIRIFGSYYFMHVIKELKTIQLLANTGATLFNKLMHREIKNQKSIESEIYAKIQAKMNHIKEVRANAAKNAGLLHGDAGNYDEAKLGGDYYMFDYDDTELDENPLELLTPQPGIAPEIGHRRSTHGTEANADPLAVANELVDRDFDFQRTEHDAIKAETGVSPDEEDDPAVVAQTKGAGSFLTRFGSSFLQYFTQTANGWSRNYRYVAFVLEKEKKRIKTSLEQDASTSKSSILPNKMTDSYVNRVESETGVEDLDAEVNEFSERHGVVARFFISLYYLLVSKTEVLCYSLVVIDQIFNASILSLPIPLMTFLWGTLYSPRAPRVFWITLITYTEAIVILKFLFQFGFFPWNTMPVPDTNPFEPSRIIGIEKRSNFAAMDIALLMMLFFHRYMLRNLGLWRDANDMDHETTEPETALAEDNFEVTDKTYVQLKDLSMQTARTSRNAEDQVNEQDDAIQVAGEKPDDSKSRKTYLGCCKSFFEGLKSPSEWYMMDLYSLMFLCDFICFIILVFGYASFGTAIGVESSVMSIIQDNKVPLPFILLLLAQFTLIVIDRALYLRHQQLGKIIFHFLLVLLVHAWLFFLLPDITKWPFRKNTAAKLWYVVKCMYFVLSAWQIRAGYPTRILGNFLTKSYGVVNMVSFKVFMAVPFLFEMRTLMDWIWTDTCMPMFDWFRMENIYAWVYNLKCARVMAKKYPFPLGEPRGFVIKYAMGFTFLLGIFVLLWLPLLAFSLLNTIGQRKLPSSCDIKFEIEGYPPIYTYTSQEDYITALSESEYSQLENKFISSRYASSFMSQYEAPDVAYAQALPDSSTEWAISLPAMDRLSHDLKNSSADVVFRFSWAFRRPAKGKTEASIMSSEHVIYVAPNDPARQALSDVLANGKGSLTLNQVYFPYVEVPDSGAAPVVKSMIGGVCNLVDGTVCTTDDEDLYSNITLGFNHRNGSKWWTLKQKKVPNWVLSDRGNKSDIAIIAFVSKVFPSWFSGFVKGGIIGIYIVVVLSVGRIIRGVLIGQVYEIAFIEIPNVDKILQLCLDIFLVREAKNYALEIVLYGKLLFVFRSPKVLIEWTKFKRD